MENNNIDLLYTTSNTRINEKWFIRDSHLHTTVDLYPADMKFKNFTESDIKNDYINLFFQQGFLHVVTETAYNYPVPFLSEKTIKPIINKRPFIIIGPPGSISQLHELGFKTFSEFWDESYDQITDNEKRLLAIVDIIKWICNQPILNIQSLCNSMSSVLNYNFEYFNTKFTCNQLLNFEELCIKNLNIR